MTTLLAIAGSLREKPDNAMLLRAAAELAPAGVTVEKYPAGFAAFVARHAR